MYLPFTSRGIQILVSGAVVITGFVQAPTTALAQTSAVQCKPAGALQRVPELPEGSGLAASRRMPGRFWSHNDSGDPVLFALDGNGRVAGRLAIAGASVEDWEAVAVGPCAAGSCIYIADIGDNDADRKRITVYRVDEPGEATGSVKVSGTFHATYPDGAHDAESLLVAPDGRLLVVTKGDTGPVSLYGFPSDLPMGRPRVSSASALRATGASPRKTIGSRTVRCRRTAGGSRFAPRGR